MIFIGLGANLSSPVYGPPRATCGAALEMIENHGIGITARAPWHHSAPVPASDQPWYVNGVVAVETALDPAALLAFLLTVEQRLGRVRNVGNVRNGPRVIDLDLLAHGQHRRAETGPPNALYLPHPRMAERAFVLRPLGIIAPGWRCPTDGRTVEALLAALPAEQRTGAACDPMRDGPGMYGTEWTGHTLPGPR